MLLTHKVIVSDMTCLFIKANSIDDISGYPLKLYREIPCVFPVQRQIFPVPIYIIYDYLITYTMEIFAANIAISFTIRIREFTT